AAFAALQNILKTQTFGSLTEHGLHSTEDSVDLENRKKVVAEIRSFWKKNTGKTDADRWFQTLVDDQATPKQWLEAAENIVKRAPRTPPPPVQKSKVAPAFFQLQPDDRPMQGETLRGRSGPSVADLLTRRANEIAERDPNSSGRIFHQATACEMS